MRHIINILFKHEFGFLVKQLSLHNFLPLSKRMQKQRFKAKDTQPKVVREIFEDLGGAFIKFGQFLSLREDLIPAKYCEELKKLQDDVPPSPYSDIRDVVLVDLGKPIEKLFPKFERKPLAAASTGQVFKAADSKGKHLAIKVQRPGIRKIVDVDLDILQHLAVLVERKIKPKIIEPVKIVQELKRYSLAELDYQREGKNLDIVRRNFSNTEYVVIPQVHWKLSTSRVLVMDYIKGKKLSEHTKLSAPKRRLIVNRIANAMFKQVFIDGVFHADPHPGNIFLLSGERIAFIDFGIVGYLDEETKIKVTNLFISLVQADLESIFTCLIDMDIIDSQIDINDFKSDLINSLAKYYSSNLEQINLSEAFNVLITISRKYSLKLPANMVLLVKSIITVEGLAKEIDPKFNLVDAAKPFLKRIYSDRLKPKNLAKRFLKSSSDLRKFIIDLPKRSSEIMMLVKDGDRGVRTIEYDIRNLTGELERSSTKVLLGLLVTAFVIASALIYTVDQPEFYGFPVISAAGFGMALCMILMLLWIFWKEGKYLQIH